MLLGALGMLVSGFAVYTLATPPAAPQVSNDLAPVAPTTSEPRPAPTPSDTAPAPSTSLSLPTSQSPAPTPTRTRPAPSAAPSGTSTSADEVASVVALLRVLASAETPHMTPVGTPTVGRATQGQALTYDFTLQTGKCYAALGAALFPGEIDVSLVASIPGLAPTIVALDRLSGPAASTVRNGECLRWTRPSAPGQLVVKSVAGGGLIAGQLFVK